MSQENVYNVSKNLNSPNLEWKTLMENVFWLNKTVLSTVQEVCVNLALLATFCLMVNATQIIAFHYRLVIGYALRAHSY